MNPLETLENFEFLATKFAYAIGDFNRRRASTIDSLECRDSADDLCAAITVAFWTNIQLINAISVMVAIYQIRPSQQAVSSSLA
jgi:hypothetical protein